ncbi:hypothetical protein GGI05_000397 [Coemansia sp. RSA 2603]|nr:hypothetical protein GGI05_000397 [Coemansia sp. RSA 2603]
MDDSSIISGNIYFERGQTKDISEPKSTPESSTAPDSAKSDSGRRVVVVGICGAISGIVLLCIVLFLVHMFRVRRKPRTVDPYAQSAIEEMLAPTTGTNQWMRRESKIRLANILRYSFRLSQSSIDPTSDSISSYAHRQRAIEESR